MSSRWDRRFFSTTRGRIVALLRLAGHTVDELAMALGLTDNAVRAHLATLERDGLIEVRGSRRGVSRPAANYELTPEAERLFPKAYAPVLAALLGVLVDRVPGEQVDSLLRETGRRLGAGQPGADGGLDARVDAAVAVLDELGGVAEAVVEGERRLIRGRSCPIASAVAGHPQACQIAAALLEEVVGAPVSVCCETGAEPRCCFEITDPSCAA